MQCIEAVDVISVFCSKRARQVLKHTARQKRMMERYRQFLFFLALVVVAHHVRIGKGSRFQKAHKLGLSFLMGLTWTTSDSKETMTQLVESLHGCLGPTGEICSERGFCKCGVCVCEEPYVGNFCEIGTGTENKLCSFYEPCVTCLIEQKLGKGMCDNITETCSSAQERERFAYAFVSDEIEANVRCVVRIERQHSDKPEYNFAYHRLSRCESYLIIENTKPDPQGYWYIIWIGVFTSIILCLLVIIGVIWICYRRYKAAASSNTIEEGAMELLPRATKPAQDMDSKLQLVSISLEHSS